MTITTDMSSSPRRLRHSRSSRQWSSLRGQDRHPFGLGGFGQPEVHVERRRHLLAESGLERVPRRGQPGQVKDGALHERSTALGGRMLVQRDDVRPGGGQEGTDRGDQTRSVGAVQQQPADVVDRKLSLVERGKPAGSGCDATSVHPPRRHRPGPRYWQDSVQAAQLPAHSPRRGPRPSAATTRSGRPATNRRPPCRPPRARRRSAAAARCGQRRRTRPRRPRPA